MKNHILVLCLLCAACAQSQVPGYMGRRLSIAYSPAFGPVMQDIGNAKGNEVWPISANFRNDLDLEYCVARGLSLVPSLKYGTSKMRYVNFQDLEDTVGKGFVGDVKLQSLVFGIKLKNYSFVSRGGIAPQGNYFSFEVMYEQSFVAGSEYNNYYGAGNSYDVHVDFDTLNYRPQAQILVSIGGGKQEIYNDKWLLDIGWEIGMSLNGAYFENKVYNVDYEPDFSNYANFQIAKTYMLNFSIGFGYLFKN